MRHIIFDFDGTLADSLPLFIELGQELTGIQITPEDVGRYRNMPSRDILKEVKVPIYRFPALLVKGKALMMKRMNEVKAFPGLNEVVESLGADPQNKLYVVSSNSAGIINSFLKTNGLSDNFASIYGNVGLFSKAQAIKKVMKREGFGVADSVYIGDEVRDIEAAQKVGMPIVSVTWGFNGRQLLEKSKPIYLVDTPKEIAKIING
jgi:phosphoglycolate phosphatase-like HAD superfamily hydrolase